MGEFQNYMKCVPNSPSTLTVMRKWFDFSQLGQLYNYI